VHQLAQRVLDYIRRQELLKPGDRIGVAVSGGADSVALLRLLLELHGELGVALSVVHFNHKLRWAESDSDQEFVASLARKHNLDFTAGYGDVAKHAEEERLSVETAARKLRYDFFTHQLESLDKIATGHTLDDQAETVLMRLIRGTGMRGLRGIQPRIEVKRKERSGEIVRPLLAVRRHELEQYLGTLGQPWCEDSTNSELRYTRNRVRQLLLPLLESEFNPAIAEGLSELAEVARAEEDYWGNEASGWMGTAVQWTVPQMSTIANPLVQIAGADEKRPSPRTIEQEPMNASLDVNWLQSEPLALQRRVVKAIGDYAGVPLEFKHIEEILRFAGQMGSSKKLVLPRGWEVVRQGDTLEFQAPGLNSERPTDYEYRLPLPGQIAVPETGTVFQALHVTPGTMLEGCNPDHLFDPTLLSKELVVRNWRPGDRFWPAHTKSSKKIKELLQERHVPQAERKLWPVVVSGDEIVWVRGFATPARFRPGEVQEAVLIREVAPVT
jgi:tRNA(Ile)-lysidine synthase